MPEKDYKQMREAAKILREKILAHLQEHGSSTAGDLAVVLGYPKTTVRDCLQRLIKYQCVRVVRGTALCQTGYAEYHFLSMDGGGEDCDTPRRPVYRDYPPNKVRDPFALPVAFFGARAI